jgi:hypothetical protein
VTPPLDRLTDALLAGRVTVGGIQVVDAFVDGVAYHLNGLRYIDIGLVTAQITMKANISLTGTNLVLNIMSPPRCCGLNHCPITQTLS